MSPPTCSAAGRAGRAGRRLGRFLAGRRRALPGTASRRRRCARAPGGVGGAPAGAPEPDDWRWATACAAASSARATVRPDARHEEHEPAPRRSAGPRRDYPRRRLSGAPPRARRSYSSCSRRVTGPGVPSPIGRAVQRAPAAPPAPTWPRRTPPPRPPAPRPAASARALDAVLGRPAQELGARHAGERAVRQRRRHQHAVEHGEHVGRQRLGDVARRRHPGPVAAAARGVRQPHPRGGRGRRLHARGRPGRVARPRQDHRREALVALAAAVRQRVGDHDAGAAGREDDADARLAAAPRAGAPPPPPRARARRRAARCRAPRRRRRAARGARRGRTARRCRCGSTRTRRAEQAGIEGGHGGGRGSLSAPSTRTTISRMG